MVRKVGFGNKEQSVADAYLDKFRARNRKKREATEIKPKKPRGKVKRQWFAIAFLLFWLTCWSGAMMFAIAFAISPEGDAFLWIWVFFAAIGWLFAAFSLLALIKGTPVDD